jgi:hypothetical protein
MVYLVMLATQVCRYDPYTWDNRTMKVAHLFISANYADLLDGQVVDVEFILGESKKPKLSERPVDPGPPGKACLFGPDVE